VRYNGGRQVATKLLRVSDLNRGRWKLSVRFNGATLAAGKEVEIGEDTALPIQLPR